MATKVYGIYGRTTVEINLPVGRATLPLVFERGCLDRKNFRPATFMTSKPAIQAMIENSELYGGTIVLVKTYGEESEPASAAEEIPKPAAKAAKKTETAASADAKDYPEVTTKEEAYAVLKSLGAKAVELKDTAAFKAAMNRYGVTFSNFGI